MLKEHQIGKLWFQRQWPDRENLILVALGQGFDVFEKTSMTASMASLSVARSRKSARGFLGKGIYAHTYMSVANMLSQTPPKMQNAVPFKLIY